MVETVLTMADIYFSVTQHGKKSGTEAEKKVTREKQLGKFEDLCRDASLTEKGARTRIKTLREYALKMPVYVRRDARMEAGEDLWAMMVAYGVREAEDGYNDQSDAEDFWNDHCKQLGMVDWDLAARKADEPCVGCKTNGRTCEYASYNAKQKGCRACVLRGDSCDMPWLSSDELEERDVAMSISAPIASPHKHDSILQSIGTKRKRVEDAISPSKARRPHPEHSSDDDDDMPMQVISISPAKPPRKHTGKRKKEPILQPMDVDPSTSSTVIARADIAPLNALTKLKALQPQPAKEILKLSAPPEIPPKKRKTKQPSVSVEIVGPAEEAQYATVVKKITASSSKLPRQDFDPDWLDGIRNLVKDLSTTCLERIREEYLDVWVGIVAIDIWEQLDVDKWNPPKKWQIEMSNLSICHSQLSRWDAVPFVVPEEHRCKHCPPGKCQYIARSSSRYKGHKCRMCFLKNLPPCLPGAKPRNSVASVLSASIVADAARDGKQGSVVKSAKSKSDASASTTDVDVDMVSDSEKGDEDIDEDGKEVDEESSEDYKRIQNVLQNAPASKFKDRKWLSNIQRRVLKLPVQEQELIRVEFTDVWVQIVLMDISRAACSEDSEALQKLKLKGSRIRHVDLTQFDLHAQAVEEPCASCPDGGKCQYVDVSGILYKGRKCRMCFLMKRACSLPKRQKQEESDMEVEDEEEVEEVVDVDVVMKTVRKSKNANAKEKEQAKEKEKEEQTKEKEKGPPTEKVKSSKPKRARGVEESPLSISNWTSLSNPPPPAVQETPPPADEDSAPVSPNQTPRSPLFSSPSQSPQHVVTPTRQYTFPQLGRASPPSSRSRMVLDSPPRREMSPRRRREPETPYSRRLSNPSPPRQLQESRFTVRQLVDSPTRRVVDSPTRSQVDSPTRPQVDSPTRQESQGFPLPPSGPPPLTLGFSLPTPSSSRDHSGSSSRQPSDSLSREASGSSSRRPSGHDHRALSNHGPSASGLSNRDAHEFPAPPYPHTRPISTSAPEHPVFPPPPSHPPTRLSWTKTGPSSGQFVEELSKTERYFGRTHASQPGSHDGHSPGSRHDPRSPIRHEGHRPPVRHEGHRSPSRLEGRSPSRRDGPSSIPRQQYDTDLSIRYHLEKEVKMKEVEIAQRDEALRVRDAEVESLRRELDAMKAAWARKEEEVVRAEKEKEQALSRVRFIESGMRVLLQPTQDII